MRQNIFRIIFYFLELFTLEREREDCVYRVVSSGKCELQILQIYSLQFCKPVFANIIEFTNRISQSEKQIKDPWPCVKVKIKTIYKIFLHTNNTTILSSDYNNVKTRHYGGAGPVGFCHFGPQLSLTQSWHHSISGMSTLSLILQ